MRTVFFVGMHNKPGMRPLDSNTVSGKTVDAIIQTLGFNCVKTNLCDVDYLPDERSEILTHNLVWREKYQPQEDSVIVLLGNWVHKNFLPNIKATIIKLPHPASWMGRVDKKEYIRNASVKIVKHLSNQPSAAQNENE